VTPKLLSLVAAAALVAGLAAPGPAAAVAGRRAETTVTIQTQNGEFWGYLYSPRPRRCANGRTVVLYKQVGTVQDPSVDKRMASDVSSLSGTRYKWSTGTTGLRHGRYYARVKRTPYCQGDTSDTVRATTVTLPPPIRRAAGR
jgi:hypothetical protein